ncbi:hypothetical protein BD626DRAFT_36871 [Schizophyllum amplum]|uniref:Uncharacterized protein n=1 Tax=Schizophyllum amplum TaxID=97359 RepID=A0A550CEW1_9AGAR|nr:hypothetical protein BD626DRAFT_36871 [Auriculariopsis ampla]
MSQVSRVACHALDRAGSLSDIRKVALCVRHRLRNHWVADELKRLVMRKESLSAADIALAGLNTSASIAGARERLLSSLLSAERTRRRIPPSCGPGAKCSQCNRTATCDMGCMYAIRRGLTYV